MKLLLMLAAVTTSPSGPAVLHIHSYQFGEQFAYFTTFARCDAFRRGLEQEWEQVTRTLLGISDPSQPTTKPVRGTETIVECVPG